MDKKDPKAKIEIWFGIEQANIQAPCKLTLNDYRG